MKHLLRILPITLLAVACNDEIEHGAPIIGFDAQAEHTRAVADISSLQANGFSVWGGYEGTTVFDGRKVSYASGAWTYDNPEVWVLDKEYHFFALYPFETIASVATFKQSGEEYDVYQIKYTVPDDASTDLLTAFRTVETDNVEALNNPVNLQFSHVLTRINIKIEKNEVNKANKIVIKEVTLGGVWKTGTLNTSRHQEYDDNWDFSGSTTTSFMETTTTELSKGSNDAKAILTDLLLIPQKIGQQKIPLYLKYEFYDSETNTLQNTINATAYLPMGEWMAGKIYTYTIVLAAEDMEIKITTPTVESWGDDVPSGTIIIQ